MSRLRLKYVQSFGGYHYFRRAGYPRIPLPGIVGSAEFMQAYQDALEAAANEIGASRNKPGSVSAAIASYYRSGAFLKGLAPSSQQVRRSVLEAFRKEHGAKLVAAMPRKFIAALLDTMEPSTARNWFKAIRALVEHGIEVGLLRVRRSASSCAR
jgi:hypothetical protein